MYPNKISRLFDNNLNDFNPLQPGVAYLYALKTSENIFFQEV